MSWFKVFELEAEALWEKRLLVSIREYGAHIPSKYEQDLFPLLPAHSREWFGEPKSTWKELTPSAAKGSISAEESIIFNGNIDGDVESIARTSHIFTALPDTVRNDKAFHDRWHAYHPRWEMPKLKPEHLTGHLGFIAETGDEYVSECAELGATRLIPDGPLPQGDIFSIGMIRPVSGWLSSASRWQSGRVQGNFR